MLIRDRVKELRRVRAGELRPNPKNWRTHSKEQRGALRGLLAEVGYAVPVVARELPDGTLQLLDGHLRAETLPEQEIPVAVLDVTEEEADKLLLTIDPLAAMAGRNDEAVAALLKGVATDSDEVKALLASLQAEAPAADGLTDADDVPEVPESKVYVKPGQLYALGEHRILCGDSTKLEDVVRLMGGQRAGLMNTDPPYGVAYANDDRPNPGVAKPRVAKPRVANDVLADEQLQAFLEKSFTAAKAEALTENAAWYMWHAHLTQGYFAAAAAAANVVLHRQIIWVKPSLLLGRGQYHWKHEPCFMGWVKGKTPPDYGEGNGERTQTTVWEVGSVSQAERKEFNHATPKPVRLFEIPMVKHLKRGEVAFEPFSGSGPQIIAAEKTNRRCFAIELEPRYVQVAIERWRAFTGKQPQLLEDGSKASAKKGKKK